MIAKHDPATLRALAEGAMAGTLFPRGLSLDTVMTPDGWLVTAYLQERTITATAKTEDEAVFAAILLALAVVAEREKEAKPHD